MPFCTILSLELAMPKARVPPCGFGISTLRIGPNINLPFGREIESF